METDPFLSKLYPLFDQHREPEFASWQTAYMRDQFVFFGVRKPRLLEIVGPLIREFPCADEAELQERIELLWAQREREFHYTALALAKKHLRLATPKFLTTFEMMVRTHSWWDTVDEIAAHLIGGLVKRHPELREHLDSWLDDSDLWIRRTGIIYQLRWKDTTDVERLFAACLKLSHEKEFFIRKAIGWSLREYAKAAPEAVKNFLHSHGAKLPSLSLREARKHLERQLP